MKKYILLLTALSLLTLGGCKPRENTPPAPPVDDAPKPILHHPGDRANTDGYNKVDEYSFDFNSDGEPDTLELLTSAHIEDGEIHHDDGQNWMVTVTTNDGVYTLFNSYIQLGNLELNIGEFYNETTQPVVILTQTTGAGKTITHYTYKDNAFAEELVYSTDTFTQGGANIVGTIK